MSFVLSELPQTILRRVAIAVGIFCAFCLLHENILSNTVNAEDNFAERSAQIPFLLHADAYSEKHRFVEIVKVACVSWKFDGVEVSLSSLKKEAGNHDFGDYLKDVALQIQGDLVNLMDRPYFHLSIDTDMQGSRLEDEVANALKLIPFNSCSVVGMHTTSIAFIRRAIEVPVMYEVGAMSSGVDVSSLTESARKIAPNTEVLVPSNAIRYRFDLGLKDVRNALVDASRSCEVGAIRFHCLSDELSTSESAISKRETFRISLIEHLATSRPKFISITSSSPLEFQIHESEKIGVGSKTFRDMIVVLRNEIDVSREIAISQGNRVLIPGKSGN